MALAVHTSILTGRHVDWIVCSNETKVRRGLPNAFDPLAGRVLALEDSELLDSNRTHQPREASRISLPLPS